MKTQFVSELESRGRSLRFAQSPRRRVPHPSRSLRKGNENKGNENSSPREQPSAHDTHPRFRNSFSETNDEALNWTAQESTRSRFLTRRRRTPSCIAEIFWYAPDRSSARLH